MDITILYYLFLIKEGAKSLFHCSGCVSSSVFIFVQESHAEEQQKPAIGTDIQVADREAMWAQHRRQKTVALSSTSSSSNSSAMVHVSEVRTSARAQKQQQLIEMSQIEAECPKTRSGLLAMDASLKKVLLAKEKGFAAMEKEYVAKEKELVAKEKLLAAREKKQKDKENIATRKQFKASNARVTATESVRSNNNAVLQRYDDAQLPHSNYYFQSGESLARADSLAVGKQQSQLQPWHAKPAVSLGNQPPPRYTGVNHDCGLKLHAEQQQEYDAVELSAKRQRLRHEEEEHAFKMKHNAAALERRYIC